MARRASTLGLSQIRAMLEGYRERYSGLGSQLSRIGRDLDSVEAAAMELGVNGGAPRRGPGRPRKNPMSASSAPNAGQRGPGRPRKAKRGGGGRRRKGEDLASVIAKVLGVAKKPMRAAEVAHAATQSGYSTSSSAFPRIVAMRLAGDRKRFRRAGRGLYSLAGVK